MYCYYKMILLHRHKATTHHGHTDFFSSMGDGMVGDVTLSAALSESFLRCFCDFLATCALTLWEEGIFRGDVDKDASDCMMVRRSTPVTSGILGLRKSYQIQSYFTWKRNKPERKLTG